MTVRPLRDQVLVRPHGNVVPQSPLAQGVVRDTAPVVQWATILQLGPQCRPGLEEGLEVVVNTAAAQYVGEWMIVPQKAIWARRDPS